MTELNAGDIRLDADGNPYLTKKPVDHVAHGSPTLYNPLDFPPVRV